MGDPTSSTPVPEFRRERGCFDQLTLILILSIALYVGIGATKLFGRLIGILVGLLAGVVSAVPCVNAVSAFLNLFGPKQVVVIPSDLFQAYSESNRFGGYQLVEIRNREGEAIRGTLIGEGGVPKLLLNTKAPLRTDEIVAIRKDPKDRDFWNGAVHSPWVEIDANVGPQPPDRPFL